MAATPNTEAFKDGQLREPGACPWHSLRHGDSLVRLLIDRGRNVQSYLPLPLLDERQANLLSTRMR